MGPDDRPDGRRWRRGFPLRARLPALAAALLVLAPLVVGFLDWATAVRLAASSAGGAAFNLAAVRFLGEEWRPDALDPRIVAASVEQPPSSGPYAGYGHAVHVEVTVEWRPIFQALIGGPYHVRGRATGAVMKNANGEWMPLLVE